MKQKLQQFNEINKYNEMIEYLKQNNEYWINNDIWDISKLEISNIQRYKRICLPKKITNEIKLELKYSILYCCKNKLITASSFEMAIATVPKKINNYLNFTKSKAETLFNISDSSFLLYLLNHEQLSEWFSRRYINGLKYLKQIIQDSLYDIDEIEKDVWNCLKIQGTRISATCSRKGYTINFLEYPQYYRNCMKKYFRTIITKKSLSQCLNIHVSLVSFFKNFAELGYGDGFLRSLSRKDIEKYIIHINGKYQGKNGTYINRLLSYPRTFLEYIQIANYEEAPTKEISFLIFQDDLPKREKFSDTLKKIKFVPEPILQQLDDNIMKLDRPELIPIYVLIRETGWRGTDIFNLRYDNCLEKIWNCKENKYNYYLCGEITKTGIPNLKIPIRDTVAEMIEKNISESEELSNENNNPNKYLFNVYEGKLKGLPIPKSRLINSIKRLIKTKEIKDENGNLFHFKIHSLRHTRAKEYVEQGINISIIQQILGHRSLQMTIHYATVTENTLYEQWKNTEDLNLFKIDTKSGRKEEINNKEKEDFVKYEYVRKNLDAVKVPFGVCFKPSKLPCKQQINQCLTCASFCTTTENLNEYKEEIKRVEEQIKISKECGRILWQEKNEEYLKLLKDMVTEIQEHNIVHKNGNSREEK